MIVYIALLWILSELSAPAWLYVLMGIGIFCKILNWGIKLAS